jgi:hypothetical protein
MVAVLLSEVLPLTKTMIQEDVLLIVLPLEADLQVVHPADLLQWVGLPVPLTDQETMAQVPANPLA